MTLDTEHFLSMDNDGHWYVVPVDMETEWQDWLELDADDEASWEPPYGIIEIGGSPSLVKFTEYRID